MPKAASSKADLQIVADVFAARPRGSGRDAAARATEKIAKAELAQDVAQIEAVRIETLPPPAMFWTPWWP